MQIRMAALTNRGLVRDHNEDAVYADERDRIVVVCDGMGGHAGGHVASELAVQVISNALHGHRGTDWNDEDKVVEALKHAVFGANDHILARARIDPELFDMGTTLVACAFMADRVVTAYVGDSRIYRLARGGIVQVSEDHSLVAERIRDGLLEPDSEEARLLANIVTRALGMEQITVDMTVEDLAPGDIYLLCSDGLHDVVEPPEMYELVQRAKDLEAACFDLVDLANRRGGPDNITVVLAKAGP